MGRYGECGEYGVVGEKAYVRWGVVYIPIPPLKSKKVQSTPPRMTKTATQSIIKPSTTKKQPPPQKAHIKTPIKAFVIFLLIVLALFVFLIVKKLLNAFIVIVYY